MLSTSLSNNGNILAYMMIFKVQQSRVIVFDVTGSDNDNILTYIMIFKV